MCDKKVTKSTVCPTPVQLCQSIGLYPTRQNWVYQKSIYAVKNVERNIIRKISKVLDFSQDC